MQTTINVEAVGLIFANIFMDFIDMEKKTHEQNTRRSSREKCIRLAQAIHNDSSYSEFRKYGKAICFKG